MIVVLRHLPRVVCMSSKFKLTCLVFFTTAKLFFAQSITIDGTISNEGNPIPFATVVVSSDEKGSNIIGYTTSLESGYFAISIDPDITVKELWLTARHVSHVPYTINLGVKSQSININMKVGFTLKEVVLSGKRKIKIQGDTIVYDVKGLKKEKDFTIEEVIARIPGVEILDNGQIRYNDKPISHLYLNGVDLLEGRYNVATRGVPAEVVEDVEILRRHNHARIDKGDQSSDEVAFNLKFKEGQKVLLGSVKADGGTPLATGLFEFTPLYIQDNFQDIASFKINNFGKSVIRNGTSLTIGNSNFDDAGLDRNPILSPPNTQGNSLSQQYWFDNESMSITNSALYKVGEYSLFKIGATYNSEDSQMFRLFDQVFFSNNDRTVVNQSSDNNLKERLFNLSLIQEINRDHVYLNNKLNISNQMDMGSSFLIQNNEPINQTFRREVRSISDDMIFKLKLGESTLENGLTIQYLESEEKTETNPAVFTGQIPSFGMGESSFQDVNTQQLSFGAYSNFNFKIGKTIWDANQNVTWISQNLQGDLHLGEDQLMNEGNFPFNSQFELNVFKSSTNLTSTYELGRFKFNITPELDFMDVRKRELFQSGLDQRRSYLFFQPSVRISYRANLKWNYTLMASSISNISDFRELYSGVVLSNFSRLTRNPNQINLLRKLEIKFLSKYENILSNVLFNNSMGFSTITSEFIYQNSIDENGLIQVEAIQRPNKINRFNNTASFSKRFFRILRSDLKYVIDYNQGEQIFNNQEQLFTNFNHGPVLNLNIDNNTWYGITYEGLYNFGVSNVEEVMNTNTFMLHKLELDLYTSSKSRISYSVESIRTSTSSSDSANSNTLSNFSFFYKPTEKVFLRAQLINIFNEDFFTTVSNSSNFISQSQFSLRPRQFTIGLNISL